MVVCLAAADLAAALWWPTPVTRPVSRLMMALCRNSSFPGPGVEMLDPSTESDSMRGAHGKTPTDGLWKCAEIDHPIHQSPQGQTWEVIRRIHLPSVDLALAVLGMRRTRSKEAANRKHS
eukprot:scaffold41_cov274-Pinguiococcus_pyrenoidosus.AAC.1